MRKSQLLQVPAGFRDSETPALRQGEVVDSRFQVTAFVARSDTGAVFEARDMLLDRSVALKLAWRDASAPRLLPEARQCASVACSAAVAVVAIGNHAGVEYVAAERLTGERLADVVARGPLEDGELLELWRAIVEAMALCHAAGMAVGEVSGHTVQVSPTKIGGRRAVFGRFSMSQLPSLGPHGRLFVPEVISGLAGADDPMAAEAIDLYGLGSVAIELATARPLFYDTELEQVLRGHLERAPLALAEARPELPSELSDLVDWLLAKEPDARPPSVAEVLRQVDAILARQSAARPAMRVLVVDGNPARGRWLTSLVRRADPRTVVVLANNGTEATHLLRSDGYDLLLVDVLLGGAMNALELCMYVRSVESARARGIFVLGESSVADQAVLGHVGATTVAFAPSAILQALRTAFAERDVADRPRRPRRRSVQG